MKRLGGGGFSREMARGGCGGVTQRFTALALTCAAHCSADTFTLLVADQAAWVEEDRGFHWARAGETFDTPSQLRTDTGGRLVFEHESLRISLPERSELTMDTNCNTPGCGHLKKTFSTSARPQLTRPCTGPSVALHRGTLFVEANGRDISIHAQNIRVDTHNAVFALSTSYSFGQVISVLEGQVKVKNADLSITTVTAGESLRTGEEVTPSLRSLDSSLDAKAHREGLSEIIKSRSCSGTAQSETDKPDSVSHSQTALQGSTQRAANR